MGDPRPVSVLAAMMISSLKTAGYLKTPGMKVDGIRAIENLNEIGGVETDQAEAVEVAIAILKDCAKRIGIPWLSNEDESTVRRLLGQAYERIKIGNPELIRDG